MTSRPSTKTGVNFEVDPEVGPKVDLGVDPKLFQKIRRIQFKMEKLVSDVFQGAYKSRFKGRGMEFEEVREYIPGDEVRTIDWNVTARMNTPFVKSFQEERELTVMLLVDISLSGEFGTGAKQKKEIIAEIGALLAFSAIRNNDRIGLILFSNQIELYVPPKKGVRHVLRLVREILAREPKGKGTNLKGALNFLGTVITRAAICFLISDFITEGYEKELRLTAKRHDLIGVKVYDKREISFPDVGLLTVQDLETGKESLIDTSSPAVQAAFNERSATRRQAVKQLFTKVGAPFIEIETADDYIKLIEKSFKTRRHRT